MKQIEPVFSELTRRYNNPLPRWRGFNFLHFFSATWSKENPELVKLKPELFDWVRDWGFDYVRLPLDYWFFVDSDWAKTGKMDPDAIYHRCEAEYERMDELVNTCLERGLHVTINMHRCPGYCINGWDLEPFNLFKDKAAQDAFYFHWDVLAKRYQGISSECLSFNVLNEAPGISDKMSMLDYEKVMRRAAEVIHQISPNRLVIADGVGVGTEILPGLLDEPLAQAVHAYFPHELSHFEASWTPQFVGIDTPDWPTTRLDGNTVDRRHLELYFSPWGELVRQGIGVHCGETGCYRYTPHEVALRWMEVNLDILKSYDIGWALWNFVGDFGVLNSGRRDVAYEDWHGYQLDRKMLKLLQKY